MRKQRAIARIVSEAIELRIDGQRHEIGIPLGVGLLQVAECGVLVTYVGEFSSSREISSFEFFRSEQRYPPAPAKWAAAHSMLAEASLGNCEQAWSSSADRPWT